MYSSYISQMITPKNYKKGTKDVHELVTYFISTIHAFMACVGGLYFCLNHHNMDTKMIDMIFNISLGYYISVIIYLFLSCSKNYFSILPFLVHHSVTITILLYQINSTTPYYKDTAYFGSRLYLAEFSVIPLNYIWYLKNTDENYKFNIRYVTAFEAVFRLFFMFRVLNYTELIYRLIDEEYIYNPMSLTVIILTLLNYVWCFKIYKIKNGVYKNYIEYKKTN